MKVNVVTVSINGKNLWQSRPLNSFADNQNWDISEFPKTRQFKLLHSAILH